MSPRVLFRTFAVAEAVTWALLLLGMVLKYVTRTTDLAVTIAGGVHGFVFLCYGVVASFVWLNQRWPVRAGAVALVATLIPFATVPVERGLNGRGMLDGGWRLAAGGDQPHGVLEKIQAWVLRRPLVAGASALAAVAVVFGILLVAGPPGTWFA